jgi:hypothetical protein
MYGGRRLGSGVRSGRESRYGKRIIFQEAKSKGNKSCWYQRCFLDRLASRHFSSIAWIILISLLRSSLAHGSIRRLLSECDKVEFCRYITYVLEKQHLKKAIATGANRQFLPISREVQWKHHPHPSNCI